MINFLASFITGISKFFSGLIEWFNNFYDACGEYVSKNIKNGKIFYDLGSIQKKLFILGIKFVIHEYKSSLIQNFLKQLTKTYKKISAIPIINKFLYLLSDIKYLYKKQAKNIILILFIILFPIVIFAINLLNSSPSKFFIYIIPILLILIFFESGLFMCIEKKERNEDTSLLKCLFAPANYRTVILLFLVYIFIFCSLILILIFIITFSIQSFVLFENNILLLYLSSVLILFLCLTLIFAIIYINILFYQAYFIAILDKEEAMLTLFRSRLAISKNILYSSIYSIIFCIFSFLMVFFAFIYFSDTALQFIITFILHSTFIFSFVLRRDLFQSQLNITKNLEAPKNIKFIFIILLFIGTIGYADLTSLTLQYYPSISQTYAVWQSDRDLSQNLQPFTNTENGYSILYPKNWSIYLWNNKSITFHYNVNDTKSGTIEVNIDILPISQTDYYRYEYITPGTIIQNLETNETITREANLSVDRYDAIKYRVVKIGPENTQYEIAYLILKGDNVYKIRFVTVNTIFQQTYTKTFNTMITTFRFLR